jgi:hypothetical protein
MSTLPLSGLCRLVVCVVFDLLYGHPQRRVHRFEERSQVASYRRLGNPFFPPYMFSSL